MWSFGVPNVPCGVESKSRLSFLPHFPLVPNVPCGVERRRVNFNIVPCKSLFLMYRVELKEVLQVSFAFLLQAFLMYRVELKVRLISVELLIQALFLMYRVELKVPVLSGLAAEYK